MAIAYRFHAATNAFHALVNKHGACKLRDMVRRLRWLRDGCILLAWTAAVVLAVWTIFVVDGCVRPVDIAISAANTSLDVAAELDESLRRAGCREAYDAAQTPDGLAAADARCKAALDAEAALMVVHHIALLAIRTEQLGSGRPGRMADTIDALARATDGARAAIVALRGSQ